MFAWRSLNPNSLFDVLVALKERGEDETPAQPRTNPPASADLAPAKAASAPHPRS